MMMSSGVLSILINTGNLISCKEFNKRATQSPTEEVSEGVKCVLNSFVKSDDFKSQANSETIRCISSSHGLKIGKDERVDLKLTVKVFMQTYDVSSLEEALTEVMGYLDVDFIDSVILALPNSLPCSPDQLQPLWKTLENFVADQKIVTIGVSDVDTSHLIELYNWSQVKPSVNQVNLESCCVMPPEMTAFAKENDIQLLTHNDPKDFLCQDSLRLMLESLAADPENWKADWIVRYSVVVKCRGIIQNKGYLLRASKTTKPANS